MKRFLLILVALNLIIGFHEAGHYLAMRSLDLQVEEISLGMGWKLLELGHLDGAAVNIRALPLGGYVASEEFAHLHENGWTGALGSSWVSFAGPLGNVVFAELAISIPMFLLMFYAVVLKRRKIDGLGKALVIILQLPFVLLQSIVIIPIKFIWGLCRHPLQTLNGIQGPLYIFFGKKNGLDFSGDDNDEQTGDTNEEKEEAQKPVTEQDGFSRLQKSMITLMYFSLAIGGLNLIPLLPFDGGHIVLAAVQLILGSTAAGIFTTVSIWPIFVLLGIVMVNDAVRLFNERRSKKEG